MKSSCIFLFEMIIRVWKHCARFFLLFFCCQAVTFYLIARHTAEISKRSTMKLRKGSSLKLRRWLKGNAKKEVLSERTRTLLSTWPFPFCYKPIGSNFWDLLRSSLKSSSVNLTYTLLQFVDIPKQNKAYLNVKLNFQVNHQLIAKIDKCWKGSQPH